MSVYTLSFFHLVDIIRVTPENDNSDFSSSSESYVPICSSIDYCSQFVFQLRKLCIHFQLSQLGI
uniref:Uncharacterized protein n=1 Tax=Arion vulgaris TaxID=1028688 RepID=A0A0B7BIE3_9EUPU